MAEVVGFEPTEPFSPLVFKTSAINHSATLPTFYESAIISFIRCLTLIVLPIGFEPMTPSV